MPRLSCRSCGRQIYTVSPLESLFAEERRCPRCGAPLHAERREAERRLMHRRMNPAHDPGPPKAKTGPKAQPSTPSAKDGNPSAAAGADPDPTPAPDDDERRLEERRSAQRRGRTGAAKPPARKDESGGGWRD
jgi:hypothetical protein